MFDFILYASGSAAPAEGLAVEHLGGGGDGSDSSPVTSLNTASVSVAAGALIELDIYTYPLVVPDEVDFSITGLGLTMAKQYTAGNEYNQFMRYRGEAPADSTGALSITADVSVYYIVYSLKQWTGQTQGNNGADAYVQTNGARGSSSTTLGAFASTNNRVSASFISTFFPAQDGSPVSPLSLIGSVLYTNPTAFRLLTAQGEDSSPYSATWDNSPFDSAVMASEISSAT